MYEDACSGLERVVFFPSLMHYKIDWYEILDVMLLLGHILEVDFKPDFCNHVRTNVECVDRQ